ncbi:DUF4349 domain-containing protein [Sphingorhabdus sp. Alg239-R122]|uniref:DUF4349 domain-containing protein n=1 Tax=Sphingorhabdus sp. Alg239-R122 TaxID=2305989 RepID=UPI0013DA36C3|nr:DUF4349 domain-containing protein [Sphingorhabdus sp. Alg239-R122]
MHRPLLVFTALTLALTSCSDSAIRYDRVDEAEQVATMDITEEEPSQSPPAAFAEDSRAKNEVAGTNEIKVSLPRIAYTYEYAYRLGSDEISGVQSRHADLCEKKGPRVCRIINMTKSGGEGDYGTGMLEMQVAAAQARSFGAELSKIVNDEGGDTVNSNVTGEDLSKQIVDTEARLRARTLLRDRLMEVLRSRKGTVAELVQAERGVAQVNEEIDQARSWLAEMKGRVAFSKVTVNYMTGSPSGGGFIEPIRDGIGSFGAILGTTIGAMITFVAFTLPWLLLIALAVWLWRRFGPAWPFGRKDIEPPADTDNG